MSQLPPALASQLREKAEEYASERGGDCLKPGNGSGFAEHISIFCQCDLEKSWKAGAAECYRILAEQKEVWLDQETFLAEHDENVRLHTELAAVRDEVAKMREALKSIALMQSAESMCHGTKWAHQVIAEEALAKQGEKHE
jgi:hypothetical protein